MIISNRTKKKNKEEQSTRFPIEKQAYCEEISRTNGFIFGAMNEAIKEKNNSEEGPKIEARKN